MQNDRLYKKAYNDHKAKISIPGDMVSISTAKEGQALASNVDYRQYLHQWSCFPDQNDVIHARRAYDLQSDVSVCLGVCDVREHQGRCLRGELSRGRKPSTALPDHSSQCVGKYNSPCICTSLEYFTTLIKCLPYCWVYSESFRFCS